MKKTILITGGARSGKSSFAEKMAGDMGTEILYIATAIPFDDEMKDRIKKHREQRPKQWKTVEMYSDFNRLLSLNAFHSSDCLLLDCVTIMVTNLMMASEEDFDQCAQQIIDDVEGGIHHEIKKLINLCEENHKKLILVTNELGMGVVPANRFSRIFRDIAGRINQYAAKKADEVYLTVSGIPMKLK
ncbi:MAG: bifunctional adenosylcobinamide kinase/adenosylcobinamide-phosphate guanylyltransferase [Clostridia bacterium]|nr:bifunctional adenosylcobinamide kinase/adenosylcobinamide-phosphate guanylyltransferase [Clostridia bacterium]